MKAMEGYLTIFEVADLTKLSVATLRRYVRKREIPFKKIGRRVRFSPREIEAWVENDGRCGGCVVQRETGERPQRCGGLLFEG
jgi:excisionase family DNA binding protein